jgi:hypothetical protein
MYSEVRDKMICLRELLTRYSISDHVILSGHVTHANIQGWMDASINGWNQEGIIRRLGVKWVEHVDSIYVVGAYQKAVEFWGEVTCPNISHMMNSWADG